MTKIETHAQACKRAMQNLFHLLDAVERHPERAAEIAERRHLVAVAAGPRGHGADPITHSTQCHVLCSPHPYAGQPGMIGGFSLYDHFVTHGETVAGWAGFRVEEDGYVAFVTPEGEEDPCTEGPGCQTRVEPLEAEEHRGILRLGADWFERDFSPHCHSAMPSDDRERVAQVLETAGAEGDMIRGEAMCVTRGVIVGHTERRLHGDRLAGTMDLVWEPDALAALVRERGLRIDPVLLRTRFGIRPNGKSPAIQPSSHTA